MATRTRAEWNVVIDDYAAAAGLSASAVADWKVLRDLVVSIAMVFENIFDLFKSDVESTLNLKQFGTLQWYRAICFEWQSGDSLTVVNGIVGYDPVDVTHRVVTQASAREVDGVVVLKVAKTTGGNLAALSGGELGDFKDYIHARRSPGVKTNITSGDPNGVRYTGTYLYDTLYDNDAVDAAVQAALVGFRDGFRFDAVLYVSELVAAVSVVPGVVDVVLVVEVYDDVNAVWVAVVGSAELSAGYFNWDNASALVASPAP